jgi:dihydroorotase
MTGMLDLFIADALIAGPAGLVPGGIGVQGGRIVAQTAAGFAPAAREVLDAAGLVALPGLVDAHVHFREPGLTHKEDFASGTAAAIAGGVTTALVMPTDDPLTLTVEDFAAKRALAEGRLHADIGLQALAVAPDHVAALAAAGAISIEVFTGDVPAALLVPDTATLAAILGVCAAAGIVAGITPADDSVIAAALSACGPATAAGATRESFFRSRPPLSEAAATARAIAAAAATGAAVHLRQISCRASLAFVAEARARGLDLTAETTPHYLLLDAAEIERQGPVAKVLPPLRDAADCDALWKALGGVLDMVVTDHAPHTEAEKARGDADIWAAPGGFPGVQTLLPLMLDAVAAGRIGWPDLVALCCAAPARRFGLYPRKGSLAPGADADIVLVDPARRAPIRAADQLSRARRTPFEGRVVTGWPVLALLRGEVAMRDGRPVGPPRGTVLSPAR